MECPILELFHYLKWYVRAEEKVSRFNAHAKSSNFLPWFLKLFSSQASNLTFSNLYTFSKEKRVIHEGLLPTCLHFTT